MSDNDDSMTPHLPPIILADQAREFLTTAQHTFELTMPPKVSYPGILSFRPVDRTGSESLPSPQGILSVAAQEHQPQSRAWLGRSDHRRTPLLLLTISRAGRRDTNGESLLQLEGSRIPHDRLQINIPTTACSSRSLTVHWMLSRPCCELGDHPPSANYQPGSTGAPSNR